MAPVRIPGRIVLGIAAIVGIVVLIANSGGGDGGDKAAGGKCQEVSAPTPKNVSERKPTLRLDPSKTYLGDGRHELRDVRDQARSEAGAQDRRLVRDARP